MTETESTQKNFSWFPARVRFGQEIKIKEILDKLGVESFIPTESRKNYRGKAKLHPVIPALVFIRSTKKQATDLRVVNQLPLSYLFDSAAHRMMVVPDKQMADFQKVLDMSMQEGGLIDTAIAPGAKVVVAKGPLRGVEGFVTQADGKCYVVVSLLGSVFAKAQVPRAFLELV
ncbi:MAG: UpxY family transcription antiterminator [Bacteroidales bacterium]|nr:UpxY family transcription antiterminator [Bacteroidales bacterium]